MKAIHARNVNEAYTIGMNWLESNHSNQDSRNGPVMVADGPVVTSYERPWERVLFNEKRDANPFFHLMEGLWMLAGRNDVKWIGQFISGFDKYSDDGETYHGAYGYRWRHWFDRDQLELVVEELRENPNSRRCYVQMWDAKTDLCKDGLDFPCNVGIAFRIRERYLDMTVFNRSNDIIWGAYGANAVHMSMLQEYMAAKIGVSEGKYHQISNNFHAYKDTWDNIGGAPDPHPMDPYEMGEVHASSMVTDSRTWDSDLNAFIEDPLNVFMYSNSFFPTVAVPMAHAHREWKRKRYLPALQICKDIQDSRTSDWGLACFNWIQRKAEKNATSNAEKRRIRKAVAYDN